MGSRIALALALLTLAAAHAQGQDVPPPVAPAADVEIDPEAAALWQALTDALRDPAQRDLRIEAFAIEFDLRARRGVQTNDLTVQASFLAPDYVAFNDAAGRRVGYGPDGPWLEERDQSVVRLEGRNYRQDRRNLERIRNLARTYLALTDPGRIRIESLRRMEGRPPVLPQSREVRRTKPHRLEWLEVVTPDFGVVSYPPEEREAERPDAQPPGPGEGPPGPSPLGPPGPDAGGLDRDDPDAKPEPLFRVYFGVEAETHLPRLVLIRSAELLDPERLVEHCIHLRDFNPRNRTRGLVLPWALDVYERWPAVPGFADFPKFAGQSIDVRRAQVEDLGFSAQTFRPVGADRGNTKDSR
ncbi:MAG: hypothetical protein AAFZ65_05580 [Planctomycetota bacterium]